MSLNFDNSTLFYLNPLPNWVYEIETFRILDVNQAALQHYGYSREEFLDMTIIDLRPKEEISKVLVAHKNIENKENNIYFGIFTHLKKNGEKICMEVNGHKVDFQEKKCIVVISRDVTFQKKEEQHLKLLESVITHSNDAILITDAELIDEPGPKIIYVNKAFTRMTGYAPEEVIGKTPRILQGPKSDREELARLGRAIRQRESCEITIINYKKGGNPFWVNLSVSPVADENGLYTHWIAIQRDVTSLYNEKIQKDLLAKISEVFNVKVDLKTSLDQLCKVIVDFGDFNLCEIWLPTLHQNSIKLFSNHIADPIAQTFYQYASELNEVAYGEGLPGMVWAKKIPITWENAEQNELFVRNHAAKNSGLRTVFGFPLIHQNEMLGMMIVAADKNAAKFKQHLPVLTKLESFIGSEISRKRLEGDLSHLFEALPDIICITDFKGRFLKMNKAGCEILGYKEDEIVGSFFEKFVHPADRDFTTNEFYKLKENENFFNFENRYIAKDGKTIWLSWNGNTSLNEGVMYATAKDITEEKKLKELLIDASKMAKIGSWELDLKCQDGIDNMYWSPMVKKILEVEGDYNPTLTQGYEFYKEESQIRIKKAVDRLIQEGREFDEELLIVTKTGKEKWIRCIGKSERVGGACSKIFGSFQDIHTLKSNALQLEELLGSISDAFYAVDRNWNFTYFNKEAENLLKRKREDLLGKNIWKEFAPAQGTSLETIYRRVALNGQSESFEYHYPGDGCWYELNAYPSNGGVSSYFKNIEERKKAAQELQKAYDEKDKILESIGDAFFAVKKDFTVTYWNNKAEKLLGVNREEVLGKNLWVVFPDAVNLPAYENYHNVIQYNKSISFEEYYGIWLEVNAYPSEEGMSVFFSDISGRKKQEQELHDLNKLLKENIHELETTNEQLEQFAYIASHDLQEPLRMISSFLKLLQRNYKNQLDDKAHQYIYFAIDGAKRMKQIILDLLEFSRAGYFSECLEVIQLDKILEEFLILRKNSIKEKCIKLTFEKLPNVVCFKAPLVQTIHCLLDNAIKYSKSDFPTEISISVMESEEEWTIKIKDNGIGIDPKFFEKIFIIFQRLHNRDQFEGTGIGLSIAKKHVESWGGKIWVESELGIGSIFYFTLKKQFDE